MAAIAQCYQIVQCMVVWLPTFPLLLMVYHEAFLSLPAVDTSMAVTLKGYFPLRFPQAKVRP
tara:strand:- start:366 stop:551 length:186 start_codon:yes stop_codon:yes gene_type:complete